MHNISEQCAWAASRGDLEKVKSYIKEGADPHWDAEHALRYAAGEGHPDVVEYLLTKHKCKPHLVDYHGLRWAMDLKRPESLECFKLLYEACEVKPSHKTLWYHYRYNTGLVRNYELTRYIMTQDPGFMDYLISREDQALWTQESNPFYQTLKSEHLILREKQKLQTHIQPAETYVHTSSDSGILPPKAPILKI